MSSGSRPTSPSDEVARAAQAAAVSLESLKDRVCLVIGASGDLGRGAALGLASLGAVIIAAGRTAERTEAVATAVQGIGGRAHAKTVDVTDHASVRKLFHDIESEIGRLDVLVNSAGTNVRRPAEELSRQEWNSILETNLSGAFFCCQEAFRLMKPSGRGRIINVSSAAGLVARATPPTSAYGASKAGLIHLTRFLAAEWAPFGITVNALAPGYFRTELTRPLWTDASKMTSALKLTPMARLGEMSEFIAPLLFLASDGSSFMTGHTLSVDGGRAIL